MCFFFNDTATTEIYTLSLHDALPILGESAARYPLSYRQRDPTGLARSPHNVIPLVLRIKGELCIESLQGALDDVVERSEEHTSELQSRQYLVCRLLLEKKNHSIHSIA